MNIAEHVRAVQSVHPAACVEWVGPWATISAEPKGIELGRGRKAKNAWAKAAANVIKAAKRKSKRKTGPDERPRLFE